MPDGPDSRSDPDVRNADPRPMSEEAARLYAHGAVCLEGGRFEDALSSLSQAESIAPDHARIRSMLGVATAYAHRDLERARMLCESAAKQEFFNPEVYLNLARVYLVFGRRSEALRYLRRGKMIDPAHSGIQQEIRRLGRRRLPVVPFLPRRHPINRALGEARSRLAAGFSRGATA